MPKLPISPLEGEMSGRTEGGTKGNMRIYRLDKGKKWPPAKKNGCFVLGDPDAREKKHHQANEVLVCSEDEAIRLIGKGFSIRVETYTRPSLVRRNLYVDGVIVS